MLIQLLNAIHNKDILLIKSELV